MTTTKVDRNHLTQEQIDFVNKVFARALTYYDENITLSVRLHKALGDFGYRMSANYGHKKLTVLPNQLLRYLQAKRKAEERREVTQAARDEEISALAAQTDPRIKIEDELYGKSRRDFIEAGESQD